jgi:replicative DNA helicase|tara:strand:+ start:6545 stop:7831 length:1287 start_codon:yes stop_codon:yes gene_type:complete
MEDREIEHMLLGKIMLNDKILEKYSDTLHIDLFQYPISRKIFSTMIELKNEGKSVDLVTLNTGLENETDSFSPVLAECTSKGHSLANVSSCIQTLESIYQKNKLMTISQNISNSVKNRHKLHKIISSVQNELAEINTSKVIELDDLSLQLKNTLSDINNRMSTDGLLGIATGFDKIDKFTGGWQETDLVIIGGASSMGKTSFALAILLNACKYSNTPSVIFSYEMSSNQLLKRLISMESSVENNYITNGTLGKDEYLKVNQAIGKIEKLPINIDECNITNLNYLVNRIKSYVKKRSIKLVLVDYLQLVTYTTKNSTREQEVSKVARTLKNLAKELSITIIALSQLNRGVGMRAMGKPTLSDLRESGEIEQASDIVILIHRPEYYGIKHDDLGNDTKGVANIIFAKGRNIGVGEIPLKFISKLTKFENA